MERVTGPWSGIFVAAYTTELNGVFYGYARLCTIRPEDVWSVQSRLKMTARGHLDELKALEAVEARARRVIDAAQWTDSISSLAALMARVDP